jgi:predicted cobalt transporter CbtA
MPAPPPHLIGAPHPHEGAGAVPPEFAAAFAARSLSVNAVMWGVARARHRRAVCAPRWLRHGVISAEG